MKLLSQCMLWVLNVVISSSWTTVDVVDTVFRISIPEALLIRGFEKLFETDLTKWFITEKYSEILTQTAEIRSENFIEYIDTELNQLGYQDLASNKRAVIEDFLKKAHLIKQNKIKYQLASLNSGDKKDSKIGYYIRYNSDENSYIFIKVFLRSHVSRNYFGRLLTSFFGIDSKDLDEQMGKLYDAMLDLAVVNEMNRQVTRPDEKIEIKYE